MKTGFIWLLVAVYWTTGALAASWDKINFCEDVGFCRRHRHRDPIEPQAVVERMSIKLDKEGKSLIGSMSTPGQEELSLQFSVSLYELAGSPIFRFKLDDIMAYADSKRYSTEKVLSDAISPMTMDPESIEIGNHATVISTGDKECEKSPCLTIQYSPFRASYMAPTLTGGAKELVVLNEGNMFHFEQHHAMKKLKEAGTDCDGCWAEKIKGGFEDPKARGPESFGVDISFPETYHVYGLPERTLDFSLPNTKDMEPIRFYNLDVFEFEMQKPLGIYGAIPFMLGHSNDVSAGVLWLNSAETYVDISDRSAGGRTSHWFSETGIMDVFLFPGPSPKDVFEQYVELTGRAAMPNIFGIGYHQCRWNYRDQADMMYVDRNFDLHDIPYDVLWLDIEHTQGKKYFTWDYSKFPNPSQMQNEIGERGRKVVTIIDPHIKLAKNYLMNDIAKKEDLYVKNADGKTDFNGWCWPGNSGYLDFTSARARSSWAGMFNNDSYPHFTDNLHTWNDMNEPSVFNGPEITMPKSCVHEGGWQHRDVHNTYGYFVHQATFEGLKKARNDKIRPFVLTRSFFVGSQKWGAAWTGDNGASWDQLQSSVPMLLSLSVTGMSFVGTDIGGFFGNPTPELLIRWYQTAAWQPFFRAHAHLDSNRREPWEVDPVSMARIRNAVVARYSYLPYLYHLFAVATLASELPFTQADKGPPMRPIWWHFPDFLSEEEQFMLGPALLVCPTMREGVAKLDVRLPSQALWYDLYGDAGVPFKQTSVADDIDRMVVFQRGGTIIPRRERLRRSSRAMIVDPYTIQVALDQDGKAYGQVYADDSVSYDFVGGAFTLIEMMFADSMLQSSVVGGGKVSFDGSTAPIERIRILGVKTPPTEVKLDVDDAKPLSFTFAKGVLVVKAPGVELMSSWTILLK